MNYRFRSTARAVIERAGIKQAQIADAAGYDRSGFTRRLKHGGPLRGDTAGRIARAFAEETRTTPDAAFAQLFEEIQQ